MHLSIPKIQGRSVVGLTEKSGLSGIMARKPGHNGLKVNVITYDSDKDEIDEIKDDTDEELDLEEDMKKFDGAEVIPGLLVGGEGCASDVLGRKAKGVTQVLSLYTEFEESYRADPEMKRTNRWKTFRLEDAADANLLEILEPCCDFIREAMQEHGNVVVHCLEGFSRAISVCIAYLMLDHKMTLLEAFEKVKRVRAININRGFWRQLHALDVMIHGRASIPEEDLPGAIIFEKDALRKIITDYETTFRAGEMKRKRRKAQQPRESPKSPRTSGRIRRQTRKMSLD